MKRKHKRFCQQSFLSLFHYDVNSLETLFKLRLGIVAKSQVRIKIATTWGEGGIGYSELVRINESEL